jgi:hypothetical protein
MISIYYHCLGEEADLKCRPEEEARTSGVDERISSGRKVKI